MRRWSAVLSVLAVILGLFVLPGQASANDSGNPFTADDLPTWQTNGVVWGVASARDKVFAGGSFTQVRPPGAAAGASSSLTRTNVAVLDASTGVPTSCLVNVTRGTNSAVVRSVTASPDGRTVYLGGLFSEVNGLSRQNLAALDVDTCTVLAFNPRPSGYIYAIAATATKVYFGGNFSSVNGQTRGKLGAASTAGAVLPWAPVADDEIFALAIDPNNGNVVIGGRMNLVNSRDSHALAIVDGSTGTTNVRNYPQPFFPYSPGTGPRQGTSVVKAIATDATGFYVGNEGTGFEIFDGRAAFNWSTYDQRWRDSCFGATQALAVYQGVLFGGSHAHGCEAENMFEDGARHYLHAETTTTKKYFPWWPRTNGGTGEGLGPRGIVVANTTSGRFLWVSGEFTQINGVAQQGLTRFGQGPDVGAPDPVATPTVTSTAPGQATIMWRASTDTDDRRLTYYVYRGSSTTPIATLQADSEFWERPQLRFTDTGLTAGSSPIYRVRVSDGINFSSYSPYRSVTVSATTHQYSSRVQADGASVYFRMEEATGTVASSHGSSDVGGSYVNFPTREPKPGALVGLTDTATTFNGSSQFVRTETRKPGPTTYSEELWFKTTTTTGGKLIGYGNRVLLNGTGTALPQSTNYDRHIYMSNDGTLTFGTQASAVSTVSSRRAYNDGAWHHVVATQGSAGMSLWVDGARVGFNATTTARAINGYWRIGGDTMSSVWPKQPTSQYFAGTIDEVAIYPTALTGQQIINHYNLSGRAYSGVQPPTDTYGSGVYRDGASMYWRLDEPSGTTAADASGNTYNGTYSTSGVTRGVTGALSGNANPAIGTDGVAGIVAAEPVASSPTVFSEEIWVKTTTTTGGKLMGFGNVATGLSTAYDKHLYMGNDGKVRFGVWNDGANTVITSPTALNNGTWHHLVGSQDASGLKLYVDGALVAQNPITTNQPTNGYWRIGGDSISSSWPGSPTTKYLKGSLDEAAVYLLALTPAQVQAHYRVGVGQTPPDTTAPTAPANLTGTVTNADVALDWTASTDDTGVAKYVVYRSDTAGFTPLPANQVGEVTLGEAFTDVARPAGTWYYLVTAGDAAGNLSDASNQSPAVVADTVAPAAPASLTATASGGTVDLSWAAATDNVAVTGYDLHRSTTAGFTPSASTLVATTSAVTATDVPGADATYFYRVIAKDAAGNVGPLSPEASAAVVGPDAQPPSAPTGLTAVVTGNDVDLSWTASTDDVGVARYAVYRSTVSNFTPGAQSLITSVTTTSYRDPNPPAGRYFYRVVAEDAAGNASVPSNQAGQLVDLAAPTAPGGLSGTVSGNDVRLDWTASTDDVGVDHYEVYRSTAAAFTPSPTTRVANVTATAWTDDDLAIGSHYYRIIAVDQADRPSPPSAAVRADIADAEAPTAPGQPSATVSGRDVSLTWAAAQDNIGVTGYLVHRSTTAGFSPTAGTQIAAVTARSYVDSSLPSDRYYYRVVAKDEVGNEGPASAEVSATVAGTTTTETVTLNAVEDTYANKGAPTANFGTSSSLASRGGTTPYTGYLKFTVPTAPANATLVSANLKVRTTTEATASSADSHAIHLTPASWDETTLTWNNKPAFGDQVGTIPAGSAVNSALDITLSAAKVGAAGSGSLSLGLTSAGADQVWLWSRNYSSATARPTLVLTYEVAG